MASARQLVTELEVPVRPTAVIAEATTCEAFPTLWASLLDQVWATVRPAGDLDPGRNVMLYEDEGDVLKVEVGVEVSEPFASRGRVVSSSLPAGRVAMTVHRGSYAELGAAHRAVVEWCDRHGLERSGPRWEIYGHQAPDGSQPEVEVVYLLR